MNATTNQDYDWDAFDVEKYTRQYLDNVMWEDRVLDRAVIGGLLEYGFPLRSLKSGIDVCNTGVLRGPALIAPLIADDGVIYWSDIGVPQLAFARRLISAGAKGNLGAWVAQQTFMGECHTAWSGAGLRACKLGKAVKQDIFLLPENAYDIAITCYGPCSITANPKEWEAATLKVCRSVKPGQPVIILFMDHSTGYDSAGTFYPATPVGLEDVCRVVQSTLYRIQGAYAEGSHGARPATDICDYAGMGMVMGIRR